MKKLKAIPRPARSDRETFTFTLILSGVGELNDQVANALYEAGCDDALLGMENGVAYLDFAREAASPIEALESAIRDVKRANIGAKISRVEPDDLVTAAEIARRSGRSRESVRQLMRGLRGPGGSPPPVSNLRGTSPIYSMSEFEKWHGQQVAEGPTAPSAGGMALVIAAVNAALQLERLLPGSRHLASVWRDLKASIGRSAAQIAPPRPRGR